MEIRSRLARVCVALQEDTPSAMAQMAESVLDCLDETLLAEAAQDARVAGLIALAEGSRQLSKAVRKDQRKMDLIRAHLAPHYAGVSDAAAAWAHEAHAEGLRAMGMERSKTASLKKKIDAHSHAQLAHEKAASVMQQHKRKDLSDLHMRAAGLHADRKAKLMQHHELPVHEDLQVEAAEVARELAEALSRMAWDAAWDRAAMGGDDLHARSKDAFYASQSAKSPKGHREAAQAHKQAAALAYKTGDRDLGDKHTRAAAAHTRAVRYMMQPHVTPPIPREESIENWIVDLDEDKYHPDAKTASMLAAQATKTSQEPHATGDSHERAARLHFIAQGVALAHGHHDLAAKHAEFVQKHRDTAKKMKLAG